MIQSTDTAILLERVREQSPLVHNVSNYVVMGFTANVLLALGASPVMAHAKEEVEDMAAIASSVVINIGTLSPSWVESMVLAMKKAGSLNKPVILDPVGVGATAYRNETARALLRTRAARVIRGNASEIMALHQTAAATSKGVDSNNRSDEALMAARALAREYDCTVCVSGATDFIVDRQRTVAIRNGSPLMTKVTGVGCAATAVIGAFAGVTTDTFEAAVAAMAVMGVAGERASDLSAGPGSFQAHFLDGLYRLEPDSLERAARLQSL